jgi:hypothetical protein
MMAFSLAASFVWESKREYSGALAAGRGKDDFQFILRPNTSFEDIGTGEGQSSINGTCSCYQRLLLVFFGFGVSRIGTRGPVVPGMLT